MFAHDLVLEDVLHLLYAGKGGTIESKGLIASCSAWKSDVGIDSKSKIHAIVAGESIAYR